MTAWFSDACVATLRATSSDADAWICDAPARLTELADRYEIELGEPLTGGHTGIVASGFWRGRQVVCKLVLDLGFATREASSLRWLASSGRVPELLAFDASAGFLVSERILPGSAETIDDLCAVADLAKCLHEVTPMCETPTVVDLVGERSQVLVKHCAGLGLDPALVLAARSAVERSAVGRGLCHGDFGPANLLDGPRRFLWAIDPECVVGPLAFDLAGFAIRRGSATAVETTLELAALAGVAEAEALAWLGWMAFDEAVSHSVYGLPIADSEWALGADLGVLPVRK